MYPWKKSGIQLVFESTETSKEPLNKVDAITWFRELVTVKGLQEFVSMASFYGRFIPAAARIMLPLFETLTGKPKTLVWDEAMVKAFQNTKISMFTLLTTLLATHMPLYMSWCTDLAHCRCFRLGSIGAVLQQFVNGSWEPLAFFSKKPQLPVKKYSAFNRELLALYLGVWHFCYF